MSSISSPLGSPTSSGYFSGLSTYSPDLQNFISREVQIASLPIQLLQNNQNALTRQLGEMQTLSARMSAIQTAISRLNSAAANMLSASVSDVSVAQATLGAGVAPGSYTLEVNNLGSSSTALSAGGLPKVTDPGSQNINTETSYTLTVNGQTTVITPSSGTMNALVEAINNAGAGVQAAVVNVSGTGTPDYRLTLQSDQLGAVSMQLSANPSPLLRSSDSGQTWQTAAGLVSDPAMQGPTTAASYSLTVNGQTTTITPSGQNLNAVAQAINDANLGVQAAVVNVGTQVAPDYVLSLNANGANVQMTAIWPALMTASHTGQPVQYAINGQSVEAGSRSITIAPGLTATLTGTDSGNPVTVTVGPDTSGVSNAFQSFVTAYNAAIDELNNNRGQGSGALAGQSLIYDLTNTLDGLANYSTGSGKISSLASLGLTFDDTTGHLSFDSGAFASATSSQMAALTTFLGSATGGGFLQLATNALSGIEDPTSSYLPQDINSLASQIQSVNHQISDKQDQVNLLQQNLTQQMAAADALIAQMQQQAAYFNNMWTAIHDAQAGRMTG